LLDKKGKIQEKRNSYDDNSKHYWLNFDYWFSSLAGISEVKVDIFTSNVSLGIWCYCKRVFDIGVVQGD